MLVSACRILSDEGLHVGNGLLSGPLDSSVGNHHRSRELHFKRLSGLTLDIVERVSRRASGRVQARGAPVGDFLFDIGEPEQGRTV